MLPEEVTKLAWRSEIGGLAWSREHLPVVLGAIEAESLAITGGEVWVLREGEIWSAPVDRDGMPAYLGWDVSPRLHAESWSQYVTRSTGEALEAVAALGAEDQLAAEHAGGVHYHLATSSEEDWERIPRGLG